MSLKAAAADSVVAVSRTQFVIETPLMTSLIGHACLDTDDRWGRSLRRTVTMTRSSTAAAAAAAQR